VSDPYRSAGGTPCPRCANPLAGEDDGELVCANGCGTWIGNKVLRTLVDPQQLAGASSAPFFRATPLPRTACLVCGTALNDLYQGFADVLTIGQCVAHGIWIQSADLATFRAAYREAIDAHAANRARDEMLGHADPLVAELLLRIEALEAKVTGLETAMKALRAMS